MDLKQESELKKRNKCQLQVTLSSDPLPIGFEINPDVHLTCVHHHSLRFKWSRQQFIREAYCCVHYWRKATFQCITCAGLNVPIEDSFYCSTKCYTDNWKYHTELHQAKPLNDGLIVKETTGEVPDYHDVMFDQDGGTWLDVGFSKTYVPSRDDFGHILRLETLVVGCPSILTPHSLDTKCLIPPPITPRRMIEPLEGSSSTALPDAHSTFRVLTYNILAQMYITLEQNNSWPNWARTWEYRRQNLLQEIIGYEADILCLQEVQNDHFEDFFKPELEKRGYSVTYKQKKVGLYFRGRGDICDGCATFFRRNKFRQVGKYELEFGSIADKLLAKLQPSQIEEFPKRFFRDNLAIITMLEHVENNEASHRLSSRVCVANVHILANEKYKDVKLWQVATLINELEMIYGTNTPVLLCGDLNSCPGSAPHELVLRGNIDSKHVEFPDDPAGILNNLKLSHDLRLVSAYSTLLDAQFNDPSLVKQREMMDSTTCEPQFTCFFEEFSRTIDYIFFSVDKFKLKGLLELVDREDIGVNTIAPTPRWSSDHIALMAEFFLKGQVR